MDHVESMDSTYLIEENLIVLYLIGVHGLYPKYRCLFKKDHRVRVRVPPRLELLFMCASMVRIRVLLSFPTD
jgi:hypothetical protein